MLAVQEKARMTRKKILVVSGELLLAKAIDICLTNRGYDVKALCSGADAIKYLIQGKPNSIVLDMRLPDCDGWFVARLLGKLEWQEKVPLILMSVQEPDRRKAAGIKHYAFIEKPFDIGQIVEAVEKSLSA